MPSQPPIPRPPIGISIKAKCLKFEQRCPRISLTVFRIALCLTASGTVLMLVLIKRREKGKDNVSLLDRVCDYATEPSLSRSLGRAQVLMLNCSIRYALSYPILLRIRVIELVERNQQLSGCVNSSLV